ncbi:hypothetical protein [Xenorhabdus poinarii]|uniref:hypothetical protein n=1 Tax=Xenorhabdus poinarii TaxID=40577 RepID=UPI000AA01A2A|nr:hypothetical protein [Xenorhabdus poinarii]
MSKIVLYTSSAISSGNGCNGHVRSTDGLLGLYLASPSNLAVWMKDQSRATVWVMSH